MAKHFAIALDENRHIFHPGETISGVLLLNTDKELTLRSIRVELIGMGRVSIREYKTTYVNRTRYVNLCKTLLGGQTGRRFDFTFLFQTFRTSSVAVYQSNSTIC